MDKNTNEHQNVEQKNELAAVPIFRANDLYVALFPEIKPLFERGEEPTGKSVYNAIIQNINQHVILDQTCLNAITDLEKAKDEDLPKEFGLEKVPINEYDHTQIDYSLIEKLLKEKFNIDLSIGSYATIDSKIAEEYNFSPESVVSLLKLAKQKNKNIQKVYILSENLIDHIDNSFPRDESKVVELLQDKILAELNLKPEIVPTIVPEEIKEGDLIIADRHNSVVPRSRKDQILLKQISLLPIADEFSNSLQFLSDGKLSDENLIKKIREKFEKK